MNLFFRWVRHTRQTKPTSAHRSRSFRPQVEQLDERLLLSLSSAINIPHSFWLLGREISWTERDWYTVDQSTNQIVEYEGTSRYNLGRPPGVTGFITMSASVDPGTGFGEIFVLTYSNGGSNFGPLWRCDSSGNWHSLGGSYFDISGTHDGHVYAVNQAQPLDAQDILYLDSSGNAVHLGAPTANGVTWTNAVAAGVGWFGGNEVFAIGPNNAIYVNSANASGQWRLVDNRTQFFQLRATANDTVFAITGTGLEGSSAGALYEETEHFATLGKFGYFYWTGQDISAGRVYTAISADSDASGQNEVYAIENSTNNLYRYDQGNWTSLDSYVVAVAAAGDGYFYDVNYYGSGTTYAYQLNPSTGWTYLASGLD